MQSKKQLILRGEYPVTKIEIYGELVSLITEINETKIGTKLFEAAKSGDAMKVFEVSFTFKREHTKLYKKMSQFVNNICSEELENCEIFGKEENTEEGIFVFDSSKVNASSLFALAFLTDSDFDESYLFACEVILGDDEEPKGSDMSSYFDALEKEADSYDFADFSANALFTEEELFELSENGFRYTNKYDLIVDVFAGKLKAYVNAE